MRILVVDDNYLCAWSVAAALEQAGLVTEIARDARGALEAALARPPEAVVTDLTLPGMSGAELVLALRERGFRGRLVVMTGHEIAALRPGLLAAGADECLGKPLEMDLLLWLLRPTWTVDGDPLSEDGALELAGP